LLSNWGYDTFFAHTHLVADFYRQKRDVFAKALDVHLKGLAEWNMPEAGMFFWIKLYLPTSSQAPEGDSEKVILEKALAAGVLALPGKAFFTVSRKTPYVRCAFSLLDEADVNEALRRLAEVVRSCH
jgi:tryptophan aminotransferase